MGKYLRIYWHLIKINFMRYVAYRANFGFNILVAYTSWSVMSLVNIFLLTTGFSSVYGWSRGELYVLVGTFNVFVGIFDMFIAMNCEELFRLTQTGELDLRLTKPLDSQFLVSVWRISYAAFIRTITGIIILVYVIAVNHYNVSVISIFGFCVLLLAGFITMYSIWIMCCMIAFWVPQLDNIMGVLFTTRGFTRYPREMFQQLNPLIFLIILPLTFVIIPSSRFLIHKAVFSETLELLALSVFLLFISRIAWKNALKSYTSANG